MIFLFYNSFNLISLRIEFFNYAIFLITSLLFVSTLAFIAWAFNPESFKKKGSKTSYECGSEPLTSGLSQIEVNYYSMALLFMFFEAEFFIIFVFIFNLDILLLSGGVSFLSILVFYALLLISYVYEMLRGCVGFF